MRKRVAKKRWSSYVHASVTKCRGGDEFAEIALGYIWPMNPRADIASAVRLSGKNAIELTKAGARNQVESLAQHYLLDDHLNKDAPRTNVAGLRKFAGLLSTLANCAETLNDCERISLQLNFLGIPLSQITERADLAGLPLPGLIDGGKRSAPFIRHLDALASHVNSVIESGVDKGGNTNFHKRLWGSARSNLVEVGWTVFEAFKPRMATGSEQGPFHNFLDAVFEYATGQEGCEHARLFDWVKKWARDNRRSDCLLTKLNELELERKRLVTSGTSPRRLKKILHEQDAIHDEHFFLLFRT